MREQTRTISRSTFELAQDVTGSWKAVEDINLKLQHAATLGHLISPVTSVSMLPLGCEVALSAVLIDPEAETYEPPSGSGRAIKLTGLDRIAGAAGVSWDPTASGIVHMERDRVIFTMAGTVLLLDGQERGVIGTKDMDVRDGSPAVLSMIERSAAKAAREAEKARRSITHEEALRLGREAAQNETRTLRLHLLGHAQSKARARGIRSGLGVRPSYSIHELAKPFIVARLSYTGRTGDPATDRMLAGKIADRFLGSKAALWGNRGADGAKKADVIDVRTSDEKAEDAAGGDELETASGGNAADSRPPRAETSAGASPAPPVSTVPRGTTVVVGTPSRRNRSDEPDLAERMGEPKPDWKPINVPAPGTVQTGKSAAEHARTRPATSSRLRLPKKGGQGDLLEAAEGRDLVFWEDKVEAGLEDGSTPEKFRRKNEDLLEAIRAELDWRGGGAPSDDAPGEEDDGEDRWGSYSR